MPVTRSMTRARGVQVREYVVGSYAVVEVLEEILLWLPFKDLLKVQGVNSKWRDVVRTSVKLRQKLFLAEVDSVPLTHAQKALMGQDLSPDSPWGVFTESERRQRIQDSLHLRDWSILDSRDPYPIVGSWTGLQQRPQWRNIRWMSKVLFPKRTQELVPFHRLNPCLELISFGWMYNDNGEILVQMKAGRRRFQLSRGDPRDGIAQSWRRMYISQPPTRKVTLKNGFGQTIVDVEDNHGITMGTLAREMARGELSENCLVQWSVRSEVGNWD